MILPLSTIKAERSVLNALRYAGSIARVFTVCLCAATVFSSVSAQKIAVLHPDETKTSRNLSEKLVANFADKLRIADNDMSEAAFGAARKDDSFNMTVDASKAAGAAMGCDFFILVRAETLRRDSSTKGHYYESYAAIYAISTRTGRLIDWKLSEFEAAQPEDSQNMLNNAVGHIAAELADKIKRTAKNELAETPATITEVMDALPDGGSPADKNSRAPMPFRRVKPEYTAEAFLHDIRATVDIVVDLDAHGSILRTEIARWAGYGLDEAVEKAVHSMNWRPAERNGKPFPVRFLLRYNFKKIEKE